MSRPKPSSRRPSRHPSTPPPGHSTPRDIFLAALRRQPTERPAVGSATSIVTADLMPVAGAGFPEAHLDPAPMAALAAAGHTVLGFDNVMPLFSVWHESAALGARVHWGDRTHMPDCAEPIARVGDDLQLPRDWLRQPGCQVPLRALRLLKQRFGDQVAVVGKVFGPWTLGYHVFGVQEFLMATLDDPPGVRRAMTALKEVTIAFAAAQIDAGADAITLGDHATRDLCSPDAYRDFLRDTHAELAARIPCPLILHICGNTADRLGYIRETGVACFHFDSKVPAATARALAGDRLALMGGTSNLNVVRTGDAEDIAADLREKRSAGIDILGPECAVPLDAPWRNLESLARLAKRT